ncbi:hypothetical membrane protein [Renibacterium salmoninarum ATCC 33209]|uniref:Hypothetical membrane protein n=1 Tax=Renibacterium salmoninarum (strain ATCC 33209 / DSM 20767 / JCM 11484 / NBRC 15589 / NCIMB 2235) TaxID=288705 RepID=A9WM84_RENSM|nr:hypothetical protein [Renibacterium salmoninarum]ABY22216.1 hypothetical membrane protein [Renibacterium salmoninarum ATCC 33209]
MNATRRGLNRTIIFLIAIVLIAAGIATLLTGILPKAKELWLDWTKTAGTFISDQLQATQIQLAGLELSWIWIALLATTLILVILLISWIGSQGGGRTGILDRQTGSEGNLTLHNDIAASSLKDALANDPWVLSTSVSAWKTRKKADPSGLKVSIQARKGASPRELADSVEFLANGLDSLLGKKMPLLISISTGVRTGWSPQHRVQ